MSNIWTRAFWQATAERVIATAAQAGILAFGADQVDIMQADLKTVAGFAGGGAVLALLKALAGWAFNIGSGNGPSWGNEVAVPTDHKPLGIVRH